MSRIAVDVVLLPSDEMMDKAIQANTELVEKFKSEIVLNKENCLPHISLAMGCIDERDIPSIEKVLELIAGANQLGNLKILGIRTSVNARGEKTSVFEIEKTKELQSLHKKGMKKVLPYFNFDVTEDTIYGEKAAETSLQWIKNYPEKSSFENFLPHITIGYGQIENGPSFPIEFTVSRLALCHLGNHCTCRKIIVSIDLN
jgi:2'-5' RNA ligase